MSLIGQHSKSLFFAVGLLASMEPPIVNAWDQSGDQDVITLVGRISPETEEISSLSRCGATEFRLSWSNRSVAPSTNFQLYVGGQLVRNAGTEQVSAFLSRTRRVYLATTICGSHQSIEVALNGLMFESVPGQHSDVRGFFRLAGTHNEAN